MDRNKELKVHRLRLPGRSLCSIRSNRKWCKRRGSSLQCQNCFFVYPIIDCNLKNFHGRISGVIQASCNLSETLGIYIGGVMLGLKCYWLFFGVSIISTVVSIISIIILMKEKDD